jgi:hypothetical protein
MFLFCSNKTMDNRINEIRRRISDLRSEMTDVEASMRSQVHRDLDCSVSALQLMSLRQRMKALIADWKAAGGGELLPDGRTRIAFRSSRRDASSLRSAPRR